MWFRAKTFGWGWYPCSWQGWGVLIMYIFALISTAVFMDTAVKSSYYLFVQFFPNFYILTVFLIIICYTTGEKPGWRWGNRTKDRNDQEISVSQDQPLS